MKTPGKPGVFLFLVIRAGSAFGLIVFDPSFFFQSLEEDPFDVAVDTAKLIRGPFFQGPIGFVVDTYYK